MISFLALLLEDRAEVLPEETVDQDLLRFGLPSEQSLVDFGIWLFGLEMAVGGHVSFVDVRAVELGVVSM